VLDEPRDARGVTGSRGIRTPRRRRGIRTPRRRRGAHPAASPEAPDFTDIETVVRLLEVNARYGVEVVLAEAV
jgi:hypothetical protein